MKFFVGVTDKNWYDFLSKIEPDEVNFWQPRGSQVFRALQPGEPFLFKLKSPYNVIAGGGFFVSHSLLPLNLAWDAFGQKNGAPTFEGFASRIQNYRERFGDTERNPTIGCIVLSDPFFFPEADWIPQPIDWQPNIVSGKTYDTEAAVAAYTWNRVQTLWQAGKQSLSSTTKGIREVSERYGPEVFVRPRIGQGAFRVLVTDAYHRRCAVTGEKTLPALEAAHIKPFSDSGPNSVNNGLLLRADIHKLFDSGYLTITTDHRVEVSNRIKEQFENGREYYTFHGKRLSVLPNSQFDHPAEEFIAWHNESVYAA